MSWEASNSPHNERVKTAAVTTRLRARQLDPVPIDRYRIGPVISDFLETADFKKLCRQWLAGEQFRHVVTLNPEMVRRAERDTFFRAAVAAADIRVPDGSGIIWARWYLRSNFWSLGASLAAFPFIAIKQITGVETIMMLAQLCSQSGQAIYLLGASWQQRQSTAKVMTSAYPELIVQLSAPEHDSPGTEVAVVEDIAAKQPAVLLVAYGAPQQSLWIEQHRAIFADIRIAVGVGGAFSILSETTPRAPRLMRKMNLEWFWRLILQPQRLPRIWQATVRFPLLIRQQKKRNDQA